MNLRDKFANLAQLGTDWRRLLVRGALILLLGSILAFASVFNPEATIMHAHDFAWLPVSGYILLLLGGLECFDAFFAKELKDFLQNLQVGILDVVVALLIVLGVGDYPARYGLLIAAFLIVRGTTRMIMAHVLKSPHSKSVTVGAAAAIILGILVWQEWPVSTGWFLSFCLNVEIALRGWALMMLALWLRSQKVLQTATTGNQQNQKDGMT